MTMITRFITRICCAFAVTVLLLPAAVPAELLDERHVLGRMDGLEQNRRY